MTQWITPLSDSVSSTTRLIANGGPLLNSLTKIKRGLEKESLRVTPQGRISDTRHPYALGSPLTHPNITTDYSEALLEFITPPFYSSQEAIEFLHQLHSYTYQHIGDELLWVNSMPCIVGDDHSIPIAQYGSSNSGQMKYIYRVGLGHRYGRLMQTIAGIHYNFSLPETFWSHYQSLLAGHSVANSGSTLQAFINEQYFHIIRNFQRFSWILTYLFGASPMICRSFLDAAKNGPKKITPPSELIPDTTFNNQNTLYLPQGTSLRMSSLGYQNSAQADLSISYNSLEAYIQSLEKAIGSSSAEYEAIGLHRNGEPIQLNTNILQIENEFYNTIRPKRNSKSGERPSLSLQQEGVEYIEIRLLDLNPFLPAGVDVNTLNFIDMFLLFCLFAPSPTLTSTDQNRIDQNMQSVVTKGRNAAIRIAQILDQPESSLQSTLESIFPLLQPIASLLDTANNTDDFIQTLQTEQQKLSNSETLPSQQIITQTDTKFTSFFDFALHQANQQKAFFTSQRLAPSIADTLDRTAALSHTRQAQIESSDSASLQEYIAHYFSPNAPNSQA